MKITTERNGDTITLWTDVPEFKCKVGIQFTEGEYMQLYVHSRVTTDNAIYCSIGGLQITDAICKKLVKYASKHWPEEFKPIKD